MIAITHQIVIICIAQNDSTFLYCMFFIDISLRNAVFISATLLFVFLRLFDHIVNVVVDIN